MAADLGNKIHRDILSESTVVEFVNKKGKVVHSFNVGLLSTKEAFKISQIAYGARAKKNIFEPDYIHEAIVNNSALVIKAVCIMLKSRSKMPMILINYIVRTYTTPNDLFKLVNKVYESMSVGNFMNSIILLTGMSLIKPEEINSFREQLTKKKSKVSTSTN